MTLPLKRQEVANYSVQFRSSAEKELARLPLALKQRIANSIEQLTSQPRSASVRKLEGFDNLYRLRVGDYRVVFELIDKSHSIIINKIRHRREAYD